MQFRLKNISNENHRVEFISTRNGHFWSSSELGEPGDVTVSSDGRSWNACLTGLKGPTIVCANALPTIQIETTAFTGGTLYLNGVDYELSGDPGESFLDMYGKLVSDNPWFENLLELTTLDEYPNVVVFTAMSGEHTRIAIEAADGQPLEWSQVPSELPVNESFGVDGNVVSFCLLPNYSFDLNYNPQLLTDTEQYFNLSIYSDERHLLTEYNTNLRVVEGDVELTLQEMYENNASWTMTAKTAGPVKLELQCSYLVPNTQVIELTAINKPIMEIAAPGLFDWNIRSQSVNLSNVNQTFDDGTTVAGSEMDYRVTAKTSYPPYYDHAVTLSSKTLSFPAIGNAELVGQAYHPTLGRYFDSETRLINVFGVPTGVNLGTLEPGSTTTTKVALEGVAELPDGWSTRLTKRSPLSTDVSEMTNWSIDPDDPTRVTINVIGGSYSNTVTVGLDYIDPAGNATFTTEINFRINTGFAGSQTIFATYPNDDSTSKEIDLTGVVYGSKFGGYVTIKAFDFEMDVDPVNTYQTTIDSKGHFAFRLPETAFSDNARRPTIQVISEAWNGKTISSMHYAKPRLPLVAKCERNVPLRFAATASRTVRLMIDIDGENKSYPISSGGTSLDLTSDKTDLATLKIYAENPNKSTNNLGIRFYRLKDGTSSTADDVNPSIREIVSFGTLIDSSPVAKLQFDSMSGLTKVPDSIPADWQSTESLFTGCKDLNDPNIANWNVPNIANMNNMFKNCTAFNQDLSGWCVTKITTEPTNFATNSGLTLKPVWGTCPNG